MTVEMPDWVSNTPSAPIHQKRPGSELVRPFTAQQLQQLGGELVEQFLKRVVLALAGLFVPGQLGAAFDQLKHWADNLGDRIVTDINNNAGIDLASWDAFVDSLKDGRGIDLPMLGDGLDAISGFFGNIDFGDPPTPAELWQFVVSTFIEPLNLLLGPNSPLNLANAFGQLFPRNLGGVSLSALMPAAHNLLEDFITEASVPNVDGWSFDPTVGTPGSAKVIADGSLKTLYSEDLIQVSADQPIDTEVKVQYTGLTAGSGQVIRYMFELFTDELGSVPASPATEVVGAVTDPSGTITAPVTLSAEDWTAPSGVKTIRPVLQVDSAATAGAVHFMNPKLVKPLDPSLSGGLPAALTTVGNYVRAFVESALSALGITPSGELLDDIFDLSDEIEWIRDRADQGFQDAAQALQNLGALANNLLTNPAAVIGDITQDMVNGLTATLGDMQTTLNQIGDVFNGLVVTPVNTIVQAIRDWWNQWFGGGSSSAIPLSQKGAANGVAPLNSSAKLATSYLQTNVANGVAGLDGAGKVATSLLVTDSAGNVPTLDAGGRLKKAQVPSYAPKVLDLTATGISVTFDASLYDQVNIALQADVLGWTVNGTLLDGQSLLVRITADGTNRTWAWASNVRGIGLPVGLMAVNANKTVYAGLKWNAAVSKWDLIALGKES
ncbi:minor tail protein [Mycobacterium phage Pipsqueaks]|uniref:Minor tail protein n=2 Tax=Charlievirus Pipsqueaks TaxID=2169810 RepID=A0A142K7U0_9CAUD|nr:minor tail protein [Mycobacterium phage Pipsqueaks]AMS02173.1 minor tail protein [Mycobacterium phage Pipsqueaks]AXQ52590.1 minor tail protein [Mycobacterium phage Gex]